MINGTNNIIIISKRMIVDKEKNEISYHLIQMFFEQVKE